MIKYPFTINDLMNTDALAKAILMLQEEVKNFVVTNTIKYADPIQWNITTQYERNTVVIDPLTGTAYISVQPVPMGVSLANTDYWTVVFNLSEFVTRAARNFSLNYEENTTLTATFPTVKGGWLVWNDTLYVANVNITPGDQYVDELGGNITRITMESIIGNMDDLLTTHKDNMINIINEVYGAYTTLDTIIGDMASLDIPDVTSVIAALNVLYTAVNNIANAIIEINGDIGDLDNLNTTDKTSIVAAVNEVLSDVNQLDTKVGDLDSLTTTDKTSIVAAVNETLDTAHTLIGDLNDLQTTNKDDVVDAINELVNAAPTITLDYIKPEDFGAVGDDSTDDYTAIMSAINACNLSGKPLYFSHKAYKVNTAVVISNLTFDILSDYGGYIHYTGAGAGVKIENASNKKIHINVLGNYLSNNNSSCIEINAATCCHFNVSCGYGKYGLNLNAVTGGGIQFCDFFIDNIMNCREGIRLNATSGWVNDNLFINGRLSRFTQQFSYTMCGIHFENTRAFNNNVFLKTSVEGCDTGIWIEQSGKNKFEAIRFESNTIPIQLDENAVTNYIEIGYRDSSTGAVIDNGRFNTIIEGYSQLKDDYLLFESGDPRKCAYDSSGQCEPLPYMVGLSNNNETDAAITGGTVGEDFMWFNNDYKYFKFNVKNSTGIRLKIYVDVHNGQYYKFGVMFKDANNNIIHTVKCYPNLTESVFNTNTMFNATGTVEAPFIIYIPENADTMYVGAYGLSNNTFKKIRIFTDVEHKIIIPIQAKPIGINSMPNKTTYALTGDYVHNTDYTLNQNIKGWVFDGTQWLADKIAE